MLLFLWRRATWLQSSEAATSWEERIMLADLSVDSTISHFSPCGCASLAPVRAQNVKWPRWSATNCPGLRGRARRHGGRKERNESLPDPPTARPPSDRTPSSSRPTRARSLVNYVQSRNFRAPSRTDSAPPSTKSHEDALHDSCRGSPTLPSLVGPGEGIRKREFLHCIAVSMR